MIVAKKCSFGFSNRGRRDRLTLCNYRLLPFCRSCCFPCFVACHSLTFSSFCCSFFHVAVSFILSVVGKAPFPKSRLTFIACFSHLCFQPNMQQNLRDLSEFTLSMERRMIPFCVDTQFLGNLVLADFLVCC